MFLDRLKINRKASQAVALALAGKIAESDALISGLPDRAGIYVQLAEKLIDAERPREARAACEKALSLAPDHWNALICLVELEEAAASAHAVLIWERLHALDPKNQAVSYSLAKHWYKTRRDADALALIEDHPATVDLLLLRAKLLVELKRGEEALQALEPALKVLEADRRVPRSEQQLSEELSREIRDLHDGLLHALHGPEAVVVAAARQGQLAGGSGVNHTLLAATNIMAAKSPIAVSMKLLRPWSRKRWGTSCCESRAAPARPCASWPSPSSGAARSSTPRASCSKRPASAIASTSAPSLAWARCSPPSSTAGDGWSAIWRRCPRPMESSGWCPIGLHWKRTSAKSSRSRWRRSRAKRGCWQRPGSACSFFRSTSASPTFPSSRTWRTSASRTAIAAPTPPSAALPR